MLTEIQAGAASLKAAGEIIKALYEAKLSSDVHAKVAELQQLVFDARQAAFNAQDELSEIKKSMAEKDEVITAAKNWTSDRERYRLFKPDAVRSVIFGLKESQSRGEPAHYLCTHCYQDCRKSILNQQSDRGQWTVFSCPACKTSFATGHMGNIPVVFAPED